MKNVKLVFLLFLLLFSFPFTSVADELSDLKEQIKQMQKQNEVSQSTISDLTEKLTQSVKTIQTISDRVDILEKEKSSKGITPALSSSDSGVLSSKIDALEEQLFDVEEKIGSKSLVRSFESINFDLGGFLTQMFTTSFGKDSSESSFNLTQLELLLKAEIDERWSFFTALGFLRKSDLNVTDPANPNFDESVGKVSSPVIGWANYRLKDSLEIQIGRYVTPQGIINIEHFQPVLLEVHQPQFIRAHEGSTIFPSFLNGINVHGKLFLGKQDDDVLQYNVFTGSFSGSRATDLVSGARLAYTPSGTGFTFGSNYTYGSRTAGTSSLEHFSVVGNKSLTTNRYNTLGGDILYEKGKLLWKNEFFYSSETNEKDRLAYYFQPAWKFTDKWIGFYRYDFLNPGQGITKSNEHVWGINFLPKPNLRLRSVYVMKEFERSGIVDKILQFSGTFSF